MEKKGKERKSVGKVIKLGRELLFVFLLKATGIPTNGYIASDFKIRYLTGTHNVFPWVRIICMAKNQFRALRYRGGPSFALFRQDARNTTASQSRLSRLLHAFSLR